MRPAGRARVGRSPRIDGPAVNESPFDFVAADGHRIAGYRWGGPAPRGIVQIAHGMGEHAGRYRPLAAALVEAGLVVYASDHRGHGRTVDRPEHLGDLGPGGFAALVRDMAQLSRLARERSPGIPLILLGHSMGSYAAQLYLLDEAAALAGAVLSGSAALDLRAGA